MTKESSFLRIVLTCAYGEPVQASIPDPLPTIAYPLRSRFNGAMPELTRRRSPYVRVGTIAIRSGNPSDTSG
jgi:hypothetical protein